MNNTPKLPDWIRQADVPDYVTAHQLCSGESRLYGTESLYGNWDGQILLLAKDFAPSSLVRDRITGGDTRPYRHEPGMRTNRELQRRVGPVERLGLLYGSALGNLLRDDGVVSGPLPNRRAAMAYGVDVTRFVIEHMKNLCFIMCLGQEAWEVATVSLGVEGSWQEHRDSGVPLGKLVAAYHPAARVAGDCMAHPWATLVRSAA